MPMHRQEAASSCISGSKRWKTKCKGSIAWVIQDSLNTGERLISLIFSGGGNQQSKSNSKSIDTTKMEDQNNTNVNNELWKTNIPLQFFFFKFPSIVMFYSFIFVLFGLHYFLCFFYIIGLLNPLPEDSGNQINLGSILYCFF